MEAWGFEYKTNIVWRKIRKDGESDGRGVGFYFMILTAANPRNTSPTPQIKG